MATQLDPLSLGLVLAVLGMGGTLLTLFVLSLIADLLKRLFPFAVPSPESQVPSQGAEGALGAQNSEPEAR